MSATEAAAPEEDAPAAPDFSDEVLRTLYRYPRKHYPLALACALFGGLFGAHRAYLGLVGSAMGMFLTGGGVMVWWLRDLFALRRMVAAVNEEQLRREAEGLPPRALAFLPPIHEQGDLSRPRWASRRAGRLALCGSAVLLFLLGFSQGALSVATGVYEPLVTVCVFLLASLVVARWAWMRRIPGLDALSLWAHRLRLFYFHVDPGPVWLLALRPVFGVFVAPFRSRIRAEVQLHLQLGFVLSAILLLFDLQQVIDAGSIAIGTAVLFEEFLQTLVYTYLFVAPIGALITTQILVERHDRIVFALALLTLSGVMLGAGAAP